MGVHGWDQAAEKAEDASSGGIFLKLEDDKDKALIVFCGKPYAREVFWDNKAQTYLDADSDEGKAFADNNGNKKPAFRASINAFVLAEGKGDDVLLPEPKEGEKRTIDLAKARMAMFENGVRWFNDLAKIKAKYGLGVWAFELQRLGKAGDTKTTYSMLPDTKVDEIEGVGAAIKAAKLLDLENPFDNEEGSGDSKSSGNNGVIAEEDAAKLIGELKQLDRKDLDMFLSEHGIKRVKELPSSKLSDAINWITERKSPGEEVDPFA